MKRRWQSFLAATAVVVASSAIGSLLLEVAIRLMTPGIGTEWRNYATDPVNMVRMNRAVKYDPELGYVHLPNYRDLNFGLIGNRLNTLLKPTEPVPELPRNAILALGDSFTFGSDVLPEQSWPAHLERMLNVPVINSGVGGYGIDQMVLLGERLIEQVKPRMAILSFIPEDIERVRMSVYSGAPKGYFDVVDGKLVLKNVPAPTYHPSISHAGIRAFVGYSFLLNWVADRLGVLQWWQLSRWEYRLERTDAIEVSCLLMQRLKDMATRSGVAILVVGQYAWDNYIQRNRESVERQAKVLACARSHGLSVVDTYDALRSQLPADWSAEYARYYVKGRGHMTSEGNRVIAETIAGAL